MNGYVFSSFSVDQALGLTEVRALRRLRPHVNIVQLHDIIL